MRVCVGEYLEAALLADFPQRGVPATVKADGATPEGIRIEVVVACDGRDPAVARTNGAKQKCAALASTVAAAAQFVNKLHPRESWNAKLAISAQGSPRS